MWNYLYIFYLVRYCCYFEIHKIKITVKRRFCFVKLFFFSGTNTQLNKKKLKNNWNESFLLQFFNNKTLNVSETGSFLPQPTLSQII